MYQKPLGNNKTYPLQNTIHPFTKYYTSLYKIIYIPVIYKWAHNNIDLQIIGSCMSRCV